MGGKGSGGRRPHSGPAKDSALKREVTGDPGRRGRLLAHPNVNAAPVVPVAQPTDMPAEQAAVWAELAPHAIAARTLTPATARSFRDLCEAIVLKRMMLAEILADGLTGQKVTLQMDETGGGLQSVEKKAHTLLTAHRGLMQRVETGLLRFNLSPCGKPLIADVEAPVNPLEKFLTRTRG